LIRVEDSNQPVEQYAYLHVQSNSIVLSISIVQTSNY